MKISKSPIIVTIKGRASTGKTAWANKIKEHATNKNVNTYISDSQLFSASTSFHKEHEKVLSHIKTNGYDLGIIVICSNNEDKFTIEIEPSHIAALEILEILFSTQ